MSKTSPTDCSKLILPDLDLIAKQTELVIRKSKKFTPDGFLQNLLSSVVTGLASFNQIAGNLIDRGAAAMAPQSLHERISHKSTAFLLATLNDLIEQRFAPTRAALSKSKIQRLIIAEFTAIEERGARWLTRLPLTTNAFLENGKALEKLLSSTKSAPLELEVSVGEEGKNVASSHCAPPPKSRTGGVVNETKKPRKKAKPPPAKPSSVTAGTSC